MTRSFDPYQQWLSIPPHDQPPDHYRLLGIARYESDARVIQAAAEQRMAHIRAFQTGPRAMYTQPLLNELAMAKVRLLNPATKTQYDAALADSVSVSESVFSTDLLPPIDEDEVVVATPHAANAKSPVELRLGASNSAVDPARTFDPKILNWWIPFAGIVAAATMLVVWWITHGEIHDSSQPVAAETLVPNDSAPKIPSEANADLVVQANSGEIKFSNSAASLSGGIQLQYRGSEQVLTGWRSQDDAAKWRFKVAKLPPQGGFRVLIKCRRGTASEGGQYVVQLDDQKWVREVRSSKGESSADEFYVVVSRSGIHELAIYMAGEPADFAIQSIEFLPARRVTE